MDTIFQMDRAGPFEKMLSEPGPGRFEGVSSKSAERTLQEDGLRAERSLVQTKIPVWLKEETASS